MKRKDSSSRNLHIPHYDSMWPGEPVTDRDLTFHIYRNNERPDQTRDLQRFLNKNVPSLTDSSKGPWIWIRADWKDGTPPSTEEDHTAAYEAALRVLDDCTVGYAQIESDPDIPVRPSKANPRSKKVQREEMYREAKEELEAIAKKHRLTCGKWIYFLSKENCDGVFRTLSMSMLKGGLSKTKVHCMKIATAGECREGAIRIGEGGGDQRFVLCVYIPDIFNADDAKEVLDVLVSQHALVPQTAKPDLYTIAGLDAAHPSKMSASIWNPSSFFSKDEIAAKREDFHRKKREAAGAAKEAAKRKMGAIESSDSDSSDDFAPAVAKRARRNLVGDSIPTKETKTSFQKVKIREAITKTETKAQKEGKAADSDSTQDDCDPEEDKKRVKGVLKKNSQQKLKTIKKIDTSSKQGKATTNGTLDDETTDDGFEAPTTAGSSTDKLSKF